MKKTKLIIYFIIVFCIGTLFGTCAVSKIVPNDQNKVSQNNLVGTWKAVNGKSIYLIVIDKDDSFYSANIHNNGSNSHFNCDKGYINHDLSVVITGQTGRAYTINEGKVIQDDILKIELDKINYDESTASNHVVMIDNTTIKFGPFTYKKTSDDVIMTIKDYIG